jgi:hypothetical protein
VGDGFRAHVLRVRGLHLILLEWLHLDDLPGVHACMVVITGDVRCDYISSSRVVRNGRKKVFGEYETYHGEHDDQRRSRVRM